MIPDFSPVFREQPGGALHVGLRKSFGLRKKEGVIKDFIAGEDFSIFNDAVLALLEAVPENPESPQDPQSLLALIVDQARAGNQNVTLHRLIQPNQVFQQRALAGSGCAEDGEHFATTHFEVDLLKDRAVTVANRKLAHFNQAVGSSVHFLNV
jgi:hypothetical protein